MLLKQTLLSLVLSPCLLSAEELDPFWTKFALSSAGKPQLYLDPKTGEKVYLIKATNERVSKAAVDAEFAALHPATTDATADLKPIEEDDTDNASDDSLSEEESGPESQYFTVSPRLANLTTDAPKSLDPNYIGAEFLMDLKTGQPLWSVDPAENQWCLTDKNTFLRIKPSAVGEKPPENLSYYPSHVLYTNEDNNKPKFFFNKTIMSHYYLDQVSGVKFNAEDDFEPEPINLINMRNLELKVRREKYLKHVLRDVCGNIRVF